MNEKDAVIETTQTEAENVSTEEPSAETEEYCAETVEPSAETEESCAEVEENVSKPQKKKVILAIVIFALTVLLGIITVLAIFSFKDKKTDVVIIDEKASVLMFTGDTDDTSIGTLYYQTGNEEKIQIARDVQNGFFVLMPKTQTVYYEDANDTLYMCVPGNESVKLADDADFYTLFFSDDEKTAIFTSYINEKFVLYRKTADGEKEKICSNASGYLTDISADGNKVYYCDENSDFYVWNAETDESEKLAANVCDFYSENDAYMYSIYNDEKEETHSYVRLASENEAYKVGNVECVEWCQNGYAMLGLADTYYDEDTETTAGDLYLYYSSTSDGLRIASDVCFPYYVTDDGTTVYYTNTDGNFYKRQIPEITEKNLQTTEKIKNIFDKSEKVKLSGNIDFFNVSHDGKNALALDSDDNLYVFVDGKEKTKVGTDVDKMYIFDDRIVFLTNDNKLYANNNYTKSKDIKEENILLAENVKSVSTTLYGQNVLYCLETNKIMLWNKTSTTKELMITTDFDKIMHNEDYLYENVLTMEDLAGNYYIKSEKCLLKIESSGSVEYYYIGEPNYAHVEISYSIDKYQSSIIFNEENYYTFTKDKNNQKSISSYDDNKYVLKELTKEEFEAELDKQIKAEQKRIEEEKRQEELRKKREELEEKGKYYYRNGYYVSSSDTLYSYPSTSSAIDRHYTASSTKSVYGYSVSEDGTQLWLKVRATDESGYNLYLWVLAK